MSSSEDDMEYKKKTNDSTISVEDDEDEDECQPSGAECLELCKRFAEITETDRALAMFYLQDTKWNLDRALNEYFKQIGRSEADATTATTTSRSKVVACFDVAQLDEDERRKNDDKGENRSKRSRIGDEQIVALDEQDDDSNKHFKIMSWNIDGLDKGNLESRAIGVSQKILTEKPDIVLLQEVVDQNESILRGALEATYNFSSGNRYSNYSHSPNNHYYTMILSKRKTCQVESSDLIEFANSVMARNLLEVKLTYMNKVNLCVLTAHLESTTDYSKQRVEQLRICFDHIVHIDKSYSVFFGGDLNLRDSELSSIGGVPKGFYDVWESTGARKECLYTWDCSRNSNLRMNSKFKPKCRFDRLYFRPAADNNESSKISRQVVTTSNTFTLTPVYFELEGLEKLKTCGRFCSDHWAIQAYCELKTN